jgi:hypothetical protein
MTEPSAVESIPLTTAAAAGPANAILQGNEIIELYIKPSRWFIAVESARIAGPAWLLAGLLCWAFWSSWHQALGVLLLLLILAGIVSVGIAALQWASRVYVLTNRRVMRFRGVVNVEFDECPLVSIKQLEMSTPLLQRWMWVGTIQITPHEKVGEPFPWRLVNRPQEVYRKLRRAIEEARG